LIKDLKNNLKEHIICGISLNAGIAMGKAFILKNIDIQQIQKNKHSFKSIDAEIEKLDIAVKKTKDQLSNSIETAKKNNHDVMDSIFNSYMCIIEDETLFSKIKEIIKTKSINCESVFADEIIILREKIAVCSDEFKLKLMNTIQDFYYRILYNIVPLNEDRISVLSSIEKNSIIISDRLTPIEVAVIPIDRVTGIVLAETSKNSHSSLMLQTINIPIVININGIGLTIYDKDELIIDGNQGCLILNPNDDTISRYQKMKIVNKSHLENTKVKTINHIVKTADGNEINLMCNASSPSDIRSAQRQGIADIGLFRSEMFYLANSTLPTMEREMAFYKEVFSVEGINNIFFRLFDIGGDKIPLFWHTAKESNPDLGCRGIRFLLSHPEIMKMQIRNVVSSFPSGKLKLILPFISTIDDLDESKEIISSVLKDMNVPDNLIKIGIMVEIPSVAFSIEKFLPKTDFINLGTNDLIQYFFAVNRDQPDLKNYNRFTHPAFIKLLQGIITECDKQNKPVIACGEMSSHTLGSAILAAIGIKNLSVQPEMIPQIYNTLTNKNMVELKKIMPDIINFEKAKDVEASLHFYSNPFSAN